MATGDEDFGTARVTQQAGDEAEVLSEAIDACPADCIHACSRNELVVLEEYRALFQQELLAIHATEHLGRVLRKLACAQMHEIGLAIAAAEYSYAVQTGAARGKPGHADASAQLDKAAIVGGADIAGEVGIIDII